MCNRWCLDFAARALPYLRPGAAMLEVGSLDVNGTVRDVLAGAATSYYGVDIRPGAGVDEVLDVKGLLDRFGAAAFDLVASTEMLEHCQDWQGALHQMLSVLRPGGLLVLTTRSPGFPLHDHPADHWRFDRGELARLLEPVAAVLELEDDFSLGWPCGVGAVVRRRSDGPPLDAWLAGIRARRVVAVDPVADAFAANNSLFVPFHEYTAHRALAELIGRLGMRAPRVADLSAGTGSRLKLCAPALDVRHLPVAGDGPPAMDGAFDIAALVDTFDRVAPARRDAFLGALAGARAILVAGPFDEGGAPPLAATTAALRRLGYDVSVSANGHLPWLVPLRALWRRCADDRPLRDALAGVLGDANRRLAPLDTLEPAYRRILCAVRGQAAPTVAPPTADDYREAARQLAAWWEAAAPALDQVSRGAVRA